MLTTVLPAALSIRFEWHGCSNRPALVLPSSPAAVGVLLGYRW
ncbi:hypothetical protein PAMC26510_27235 [Caballeronia sordidicola]|uniref:Uncharacterized protein n=1 Tax=Caballeronia sordidicola TaxID=196367 RepID=A0A242MD89_CABSO|nr:hypothetical protein PAMC26510_27235 [Caballeronia sordidicola]